MILILDKQRDICSGNGVPHWRTLKRRLDENLLPQMRSFRVTDMPSEHRKWLNEVYFDSSTSGQYFVTYDRVRNAHPVIAPVYNWAISILRPPGIHYIKFFIKTIIINCFNLQEIETAFFKVCVYVLCS